MSADLKAGPTAKGSSTSLDQTTIDVPVSKEEYTPASSSSSGIDMKTTPQSDSEVSSTSDGKPVEDAPAPMFHKPPPRDFWLIMVALILSVFLASLDQIIVSTSIPAITKEYNALNQISWLFTAYLLTATSFQPLYGKFSDIFGRKATMLFANVMFLAGSAVCGWATSINMLIVGRAIAGLGAGGLMAMVFIILSDMLDMRERGKYIGFVGAVFSFSSVIGPLLGGAFTDHATWRWSFWINLPFGAISIAFVAIFLNLPMPKGSLKDKLRRIDVIGSITLLCTVILLLLPLSWGGTEYPWSDGRIIGMLVAGFVMVVVFILIEWKIPREPIVPIHLFKIRNLWSTYGSLFFNGMAFFGMLSYLPVYFQVVKDESATVGGLETIPFVIGIVFTSIGSGIWIMKKGTYRLFPATGNVIFAAAAALCILFEKDTPRVATIFILLLCGLGIGFTFQASTLAIQVAVKPKYMATVTASVQFIRSLGQVFGVAIVGTVFNNKVDEALHERFPKELYGDDYVSGVTKNYDLIKKYANEEQTKIYDSFIYGLHFVFYCSIAFCVAAFISSVFIQHLELKTNANTGGAGGEGSKPKPEMAVEMV
ncbi:hypothetical protein BGW41_004482 [Actinomortierella wolfii]|nr:hypothetical protein BGW41_004482 [Actinomortierella wolfii]